MASYLGVEIAVLTGKTFSQLPSLSTFTQPYMMAVITDSPASVIGNAVTVGSGTTKVLAIAGATQWTVVAVIT